MNNFLVLLKGVGPFLIPVLQQLEPVVLQQIQKGLDHLNGHIETAIATHPANQEQPPAK